MSKIKVARRTFLISSASVSLSSCVTCKLPTASVKEIAVSDSHGHFFNVADLPIVNFIKFVFVLDKAPGFPEVGLALVDLIGFLAQFFTISAQQEISRIGERNILGSDANISSKNFADETADRIEENLKQRKSLKFADSKPETNLNDSYLYLASLLNIGDSSQSEALQKNDVNAFNDFPNLQKIDRKKLENIAELGQAYVGESVDISTQASSKYKQWVVKDAGKIKAMIRWAFIMMQSRCSHVSRYLRTITTADASVTNVANLLVDYDRWLGETPKKGSDHADQVEFWTRFNLLTNSQSRALNIHTFAGYDPLKHAEESMSDEAPTYLETMKHWIENNRDETSAAKHKITGFKIYPPMGFRPDNNQKLVLPRERAGKVVQDRWNGKGWNTSELGNRLDNALDEFFKYCAKNNIPIFTHGYKSNGASYCSDDFADPIFWVNRAQSVAAYNTHPLKLCIGHFGKKNGDDKHKDNSNRLALKKLMAMNLDGTANIFFDIGYNSDILEYNPDISRGGVDELLDFFYEFGEAVTDYVMFGTDWVMLEQEQAAGAYLRNVREVVENNELWRPYADKIFRTNFLKFIGQEDLKPYT